MMSDVAERLMRGTGPIPGVVVMSAAVADEGRSQSTPSLPLHEGCFGTMVGHKVVIAELWVEITRNSRKMACLVRSLTFRLGRHRFARIQGLGGQPANGVIHL
jgi:hypothetical protein